MKKTAAAILVVLLLLLAVTAGTPLGLQWVIAAADRLVPGKLTVGRASGSLLGSLDLERVSYRDEALQLEIGSVGLDWAPAALLRAKVHLRYLRAAGVDVKVLARSEQETGEPFTLNSLPVDVEVEDFTVTGISVLEYGAEEPLLIDRVHLAGAGRGSVLQLREAAAETPVFAATVQGQLSLDSQQDGRLTTEWWLQLPDTPRISGTGTLQGNGMQLQVQQAISGPADVALQATLLDVLSGLRWNATVDVREFNLQTLQPQGPERLFAGAFSGSGGLDVFTLSGTSTLTDPSLGETRAGLTMSRSPDRWRIEQLVLNNPTLQGELRIKGDLGADGVMQARAEWDGLVWALTGQQSLRSPAGELTLEGSIDDYRFNGRGVLDSTGYPQLEFTTSGSGNSRQIQLTRFQGDSTRGSFNSSGDIAWQPALKWRLEAVVDAFDPAFFAPDWPGRVSFRLDSNGQQSNQGLAGLVNVTDVSGTLRGQAVTGRARADFAGNALQQMDTQLAMGTARLSASGSLAADWDMQWDLAAPDLAQLLPGAAGSLQGQGRISGPRLTPQITASLDGKALRLEGGRLESIVARVDVDMAGLQASSVDIKGSGAKYGGQNMDSVTLVASGRTPEHTLRFALARDKQTLSGRIEAGLADRHWSGVLSDLQVSLPGEQAWGLQQPAAFSVQPMRGEVQSLCMAHDAARLCARADWQSASDWQAALDGEGLPLDLLKPWLLQEVVVDGVADLKLQARADKKGVSGQSTLALMPGSVTLDDGEQTLLLTQFGQSRVSLNLQDNVLTGELELPLQQNGALSGTLRLDEVEVNGQWFHDRTRITSTLAMHFVDQGMISVFVPALSTSSGRVDGNLAISGTVGNPLFSGAATLKDAGVSLPQVGIQLRDVNMQASGVGNTIDLQGSVTSGEGVASYRGQLTFLPDAPLSMDLELTGENVQLANIPEAIVLASPDLKATLREQRLDITGTVRIPEAQIRLRELKGVAKESGDLVLVQQEQEIVQTGKLEVTSRVDLVLADKVSFDGFGLTGKLEGKVEILEQPDKVTRGQGELNIREGQYSVYGRKLDIERGRLVFAGGPIDNPGLDMRVVRQSGDVLAGVRVTGTATTPALTLFSDPVMEQSDILSYLLLGVPTSKASGAQGAALSGAAASLGLAGGDWLSGKLGDAFGLDEVGVESGDTVEESSLVLGKYLSPRMYISYAVGLFDQLNTFRMRYELSRRWSVQTETGAATGADLLFSLER